MRASMLDDPLYEPDDDPMLLQAEPMLPIRFDYLTTMRDIAIQTDMLERLGLVHTFVGRQLYAFNECDSGSLRVAAVELLMREGFDEPHAESIEVSARDLLAQLVVDQAQGVTRSALHRPSLAVAQFATQLRDEANAILERHNTAINKIRAAGLTCVDCGKPLQGRESVSCFSCSYDAVYGGQ